MAADPQRLASRRSQQMADKQLHVQVWTDCYRMTFPERGSGLQSDILTANEAQQHKARIYDSTAPDGVSTGVATVMGAMVPSNAVWFGLDVGNETDEERRFLDDGAKFIWENIHASNFDAESADAMIDEWCAGWFVLYLDEAQDGGFHFECWPVGECTIATSRAGGVIDTVYREYQYSVSQCVSEFGIAKVSPKVAEMFRAGKFDTKVKILHCIEPRELYAVGAKLAVNKPWASVHMECDSKHVLREGGYDEFPCMVPRWMRIPGSAYATGPMAKALPDVLTLNEAKRWTLMGAETAIAPPLKVVDDGVLNPRTIKLGPRKVLVCSDPNNIQPLITGADVRTGMLTVEDLRNSIRKILIADHLPPAEGPAKTAYEWSVRVQMLRQMLGPMFGRFQAEFLQPLIERAFGLMWRANIRSGFQLVGKPPESLLNRNFSVRYLSPLARAQKQGDVDAMDRYEADLAATAQVAPDTLDLYDWDEAKRIKAQLLGVPHKLVRDARSTTKYRQEKADAAKQVQQEQEQAAMQQGAQQQMQGAMAQRLSRVA
jgi:hypothetical protein